MKPAGFRLEASGTLWSKRYASYAAAAKALARLEARGYQGAVNNLGGRWVVRLRVDSFMENPARRTRKVSVHLTNFSGVVRKNRNGTVSIEGRKK
jgi:hypothetical protein